MSEALFTGHDDISADSPGQVTQRLQGLVGVAIGLLQGRRLRRVPSQHISIGLLKEQQHLVQAVIDGLDNLALDDGQLTRVSNSRRGICDREVKCRLAADISRPCVA